ncbi:glycine cleavage system H protein-like [Physella acuta]|uniref:glycine cleavage system H protein-like n=1 Tax=Physella acuta TaxID=109671 RepID=UPI0027DE9E1F|nr:glycine cleavage system H protein-like [Physella acuta]
MAASIVRKLVGSTYKCTVISRLVTSETLGKRTFSFSRCLADRLYTDKHEWIEIKGGKGTVGISVYAQEQLGEIVFVETPEIGATLNAHDVAGCLESVKAASEVYSPVGGKVTEVNDKLSGEPKLVNTSPLDKGWLYKLDVAPGTKTDDLMDEKAYAEFVGTIDNH